MGKRKDGTPLWTTQDELEVISYMARTYEDGWSVSKPPTNSQIRRKLTGWLSTYKNREWDKSIDLDKCRDHALNLMPRG